MNSKLTNPDDPALIRETFALAHKGAGHVSPNPMVGAIIVKNGKVIGKGYHQKFGGPHAEVHAIANATESVEGATVYVNLEPCNYFGKTPPCTELLIKHKVARVVVGMKDPNPKVRGKGIRQLRKAGIEVTACVLEDEAKKLNEVFSKYILTKIPFVTLKVAQTLDGKIADSTGKSQWITGKGARKFVHQLRAEYDAILVGANTIREDNPSLTVREVKGRNPIRVIIDGNFNIPEDSKVVKDRKAHTILYISSTRKQKQLTKKSNLEKKNIRIIELPGNKSGHLDIHSILKSLGEQNIASVLVEGGAAIFSWLIQEKQADKLLTFIAPKILGKGLNSFELLRDTTLNNELLLKDITCSTFGKDILIEGYF